MNASLFFSRYPIVLGLALSISALTLTGCSQDGDGDGQQMPPAKVAVKKIEPTEVDVYADYPGRTRGEREVQVNARVEGILIGRHYHEGEFVKKGDKLFSIDPRPFQAVVDQREAELAQAKAKLHEAKQTWRRADDLYKNNAISQAEHDDAKAGIDTARAAVALAKANLESAQIDLDYTTVEAPINGVTSLREIDEGALVSHGTLLTTITQLDPVHVVFSVPAEDAIIREKAIHAIGKEQGAQMRSAELIMPSGSTYAHEGKVDFAQSTIDPKTGTVRLRAIFENKDRKLIPGQFVRVRIRLETLDKAFVVPEKAISDSQDSAQVFIAKDGKAVPKSVKLGPSVKQGRVIKDGLEQGDHVIVAGLGHVNANSDIEVVPEDALEKANNKETDK